MDINDTKRWCVAEQSWGEHFSHEVHADCFKQHSGLAEMQKKYSHQEWLELVGEEWLLNYEHFVVFMSGFIFCNGRQVVYNSGKDVSPSRKLVPAWAQKQIVQWNAQGL